MGLTFTGCPNTLCMLLPLCLLNAVSILGVSCPDLLTCDNLPRYSKGSLFMVHVTLLGSLRGQCGSLSFAIHPTVLKVWYLALFLVGNEHFLNLSIQILKGRVIFHLWQYLKLFFIYILRKLAELKKKKTNPTH